MHIARLSLLAIPILAAAFPAPSTQGTLAAEQPPAAKPDPILADLKTTASAQWVMDGPGTQPPALEVRVKLSGTAASFASSIPCVRWDSVLAEHGKSYRRWCADNTCPSVSDSHDVALVLRMRNRPPIKTICELRGAAKLQTGGEHRKLLIKNAFAAPGKPVHDATLDALGITLVTGHSPKAAWDPASNHREHVTLSVKWKDNPVAKDKICRLIGFKIWDEEEEVSPSETTCSYADRSAEIAFGCKVKMSREAQIELNVHTDAREVWIPFAFSNIAVPAVPSDLDLPATLGEQSIEADRVSPDDPLVAGLKVAPEVAPVGLLLRLSGKPVEQASRFGEIDFDSVVDEAGNELHVKSDAAHMRLRFSDPDFLANRPAAFLWRVGLPWPKMIRQLQGSVALRTGGHFETVVLENILQHVGEPLRDETLKSLGVSARVVDYNKEPGPAAHGTVEAMRVELTWSRDTPVSYCEVVDSRGKPVDKGKVFAFDVNNSMTLDCYYEKRLPVDTQLRIVVHKDSRKVRIPFVFKDVEIPTVRQKRDQG
jgi:hypothetical protein